jgi:stage V sporulation protein AC
MNKKVFNEIVKNRKLRPNKLKNGIWAFLCGGFMGLFGQLLLLLFQDTLGLSSDESRLYMYFIVIGLTNILTLLGVFDIYSSYAGAGAFIPISGFANALTSSSLEGRSEGLIFGIGSNIFRLAGSVIVYGVSSALIFSFIYYFFTLLGVKI